MQAEPRLSMTASRRRKTRTLIGVAAIAAVLIYLALSARGAAVYYVTIAELKDQATNRAVRVAGTVLEGSIRWEAESSLLRFTLVEGAEQLEVVHRGLRPDMLRDGASAVVEGKPVGPGEFEAQSIMLQCPSKYEAAATARP